MMIYLSDMELTEYEQKIFAKIDEVKQVDRVNSRGKKYKDYELVIKYGRTYPIDQNRTDLPEFIAAIKKYIDCWGILEFTDDYRKFYRIERPNRVEIELEKLNQKL